MRVLIIPEDFRNDQYILQPLFTRLLASLGKARAKVRVCLDPLLGGVSEALNIEKLTQIVDRYSGSVDLFVLCVDRDGMENRQKRLDEIERNFVDVQFFISSNAWEEIETWALAGLDLPKEWVWAEIRADVSVKENYFEKLAERRDLLSGPGRGRKVLGEEAARRVDLIRAKCVEDFNAMALRIAEVCDAK